MGPLTLCRAKWLEIVPGVTHILMEFYGGLRGYGDSLVHI